MFKVGRDEEFAEKIAEKIAEMVRNGYKVYITNDAARVLEPILEKYGIVLVPVKRIEYPHILIHLTEEGTIFIRFKDHERMKVEREIALRMFMEYLEKALKKYFGEKREKRYTIGLVATAKLPK